MFRKKQNNFFFPFELSVLYFGHIDHACLLHLSCSSHSISVSLRSWDSPDRCQELLIWHFMQSSCLKASPATTHKSCKKVLFSAKLLEAFLIPHPFPQHTFICPVTCQIQPLPDKSFKGCSFGFCLFCTSVNYQKLLLAFIWVFQGFLE